MKAVRTLAAALVATVTAAPAMSGEARQAVERVPAEVIRETRGAITMGEMHYFEGEYDEALPHLTVAAERGFKEAQSQLGSIYLNGPRQHRKGHRSGHRLARRCRFGR